MNEEPPAKRRRLGKLWWWMLAIFLGVCGWQMWSIHKYNAAVREAKEAGFNWHCEDTISLIRQDWHNALKRETWGEHPRHLSMREIRDLGRYAEMLHRLRPTELYVEGCENMDALKELSALQWLYLYKCPALQNVDALKDLTSLQRLDIFACHTLQNVDGLKGLADLQTLSLSFCSALQDVEALKGLTGLQMLSFSFCPVLQNVDGLKGLTTLQSLDLSSCDEIPATALRELRAALPNTDITFPDGTKNPPQ